MKLLQGRDSQGRFLSHEATRLAAARGSDNGSRPPDIASAGPLQFIGPTVDQLTANYYQVLGTFNPRLVSLDTFKLMERDPIIAFGLAIRRAAIVNLKWTVKGDDEEINAAVTALLKEHYRKLAACLFKAIPRGVSIPGIEWGMGDFVYDLEKEGEAKEKRLPDAWIVHRIKSLPIESLRFVIDRGIDQVVGVRQGRTLDKDSPIYRIPNVLIWSYHKEDVDGDPRGKPLLENVYEPWWFKSIALLKGNRYIERLALGVWKCRADAEIVDGGVKKDGFAFMGDQVRSVKTGDCLILPIARDPQHPEDYLYDAELLTDDKRGDMIQNWITARNLEALNGLLVAEKAATSGKGEGSLAQAEQHAKTMEGPLQSDVEEFLDDPINGQLVTPWVDFNFGEERRRSSRVRVETGGLTGRQREILLEVAKAILQTQQMLDSGETVSLVDMLDGRGLFEEMGVPLKSAKEIEALAEEKARRRQEMEKAFQGKGAGEPDEDEDKRIEEEAVKAALLEGKES